LTEQDLYDRILAHQVRETVSANKGFVSSTVAANLFAAALMVLMMQGKIVPGLLYGWLVVQLGYQMLRVLAARLYWRRPPADVAGERRWASGLSALAIGSGIIWGIAGILFFTPDSTSHQALLAILLCGLAAGSIPANAMLQNGMLGSATAILGLFMARLIWQGDEDHWLMVAMLGVYLVFVLNWGRNLSRVLVESLRRRYENDMLIEQLRKQKAQALLAQHASEEASMAKSKFLAAASHDLRQPMHALTLLSGAMMEEERPAELKALTGHIARSVGALEKLFNALLDISKLDAGVTKPNNKDFPLAPLFDYLRTDFAPMAADKGLRFSIRKTPAILHADAQLLSQVLINLISNAIRYTEVGGIVVGCRKRGDNWRIDVIDTGIGIPRKEQEKVFDEFYQIGNPERDRNKGLGLGLAIVRRLAKLMDLPIVMNSQVGRGTGFSLTLPAGSSVVEAVPEVIEASLSFDQRRILIVDNEPDVLLALSSLLVGWGCDVLAAETYDQVVTEMSDGDWQPDLAIVDLRLRGEETGITLLDWLHKNVDAKLPSIIITGDTSVDRLQDIKSSGYSLLHKPVMPAKLRALMQHQLSLIHAGG
jgi:signal transduction histidine kinase